MTYQSIHFKLLIITLLFVTIPMSAQRISWKETPGKTYVFEINNKEAEKLVKSMPKDSLILKMLHTPLTSFSGEWTDKPKFGHFIFSEIFKNNVGYRYETVMPFQVFLFKEYGVLTLQVIDQEGKIRDDARIRIHKRHWIDDIIEYDQTTQTYTIDDWSETKNRIMTVELEKFKVIFDLSKYLVNPWYGGYRGNYGKVPDFYSYMITDKNKYKPNEKIRFKSYALSGGRRPLKKDLELWMHTGQAYKKITTVKPYNPGGFADQITLDDSLKLKLDKSYTLQLRDKDGKIAASTSFKYEDYELFDNKLEVKLAAQTHYYPDTNRIEIKASDANGLILQDLKAKVLIKRGSVSKTYKDLFMMPDTIMYQHISLNNMEPTFVDVPSSLFENSDCSYSVSVEVLTHENQRMTYSGNASFFQSHYEIRQTMRNDTIQFAFFDLGKEKKVNAKMTLDDSKESYDITLPTEMKLNQALKSYYISIPDYKTYKTFQTKDIANRLDIKGGFEKDSFNVQLINPLQLELSWYIYKGNILLEKGSGIEMDFRSGNVDFDIMHYVEIFYFMGGQEQVFRRSFAPKKEYLNVEMDLPERVYPGQTIDATISVKDNYGSGVKNVDLTAFAYNTLLNNHVPDLPYYGASPEAREQRSSYNIFMKKYSFQMPLDYKYWNKLAKLDELDYYKFTYPWNTIFTHTVNTPDTTTQFIPYVMKNGNSVKIYTIELDNTPIYFSWTQQPQYFSFLANDTAYHNIALRLSDRAIILDSLRFEKGKKTIMSIDMDSLPPKATVVRLNNSFTSAEASRYQPLIAKLPVDENLNFTYLKTGNTVYPVFHKCFMPYSSSLLVGPIPPGKYRYTEGVEFKYTGGFSHQFEDNIVYKSPETVLPTSLQYSVENNFPTLNDFNLTNKLFNQKVEECKIETRDWQPSTIYISQSDKTLNFKLPYSSDHSGVSNLLLRNCTTKKILYPDKVEYDQRTYSHIPPAIYDVILLFNSGKYSVYDSVPIKKNMYTEVDLTKQLIQPADSLSKKWLLLRTASLFNKSTSSGGNTSKSTYYRPYSGRYGNTVSGVVTDEHGEALIGVTVVVKNTKHGVVTDLDGQFSIDLASNDETLVFSYIGFKHKEMNVRAGSVLTVVLSEDAMFLDEVVVVGYGTQKRMSMTGSIASISGSDASRASNLPAEEMENTLVGKQEIEDAEDKLYADLMKINGLRTNFSDVGFWEPSLVTDRKGKAKFTVTFPDNITKWEAVVYAMNRKLKTGTARKSIKSYKPLMAELKTPQFMVVGDSSYFAGNIRNYTKDKDISGKILFALDTDTLMNQTIDFTSSRQDKLLVNPTTLDSVRSQYLFTRNDGYSDGEERKIPVVQLGTEVANGSLSFLFNGNKQEVVAANDEEVTVTLTGEQIDIYMDAASYLTGYKYACNEQLASKLIGLLNFKKYQEFKGIKFKNDKQVKEIIKRLLENQNQKKLWSWWGNSTETSFWMSAHIMRALKMAKDGGYQVNLNLTNIGEEYANLGNYRSSSLYDIDIIHALSDWGTKQNYEEITKAFDKTIQKLDHYRDSIAKATKQPPYTSYLKERLQLMEIKQQQGLKYSTDELTPFIKKDILGRVYVDDNINRYWWYADNLATTLIAYRIIKRDSTLHHLMEPMQMYILSTKNDGWNTYQASSALATVFPDILDKPYNKEKIATVVLSGKENRELTKFPYETKLAQGEKLTIDKKDGVPLFFSSYTMKRVTEARSSDAFSVSTNLSSDVKLQAGKPVTLTVSVTVKQKNTEYVMIEVPIPAGCSYNAKPNYFWGREVHREYFKEKVVIFCSELPKGFYDFHIDLLPRFSGVYNVNPAKAELMYFPVINANNELKKIGIKERID